MVEVSVLQLRAPITVVELPQPITMLMEITSGQVTVLVTIGNREGTSMEYFFLPSISNTAASPHSRSSHTVGILMSKLRVWLEAA